MRRKVRFDLRADIAAIHVHRKIASYPMRPARRRLTASKPPHGADRRVWRAGCDPLMLGKQLLRRLPHSLESVN